MTSIRFYFDKKTGLALGSNTLDGAGRVTGGQGFRPEFYDFVGSDNPNIQTNFKIKPEIGVENIQTNPDVYLDSVGSGRHRRFIWSSKSEQGWAENVLKPISKYTEQIQTYNTIAKNKNKKLDVEVPDILELENTDYEKFYEARDIIAQEQNKKVDEINLIEDPIQKQEVINEYLPFYDESYKYVTDKITSFEPKINEKRRSRSAQLDSDLPELSNYGDNTDYDKLYSLQDMIISEQNKRFEEINLIQDPAERFVAKEQDLKQYGDYLNFANEKITSLDTRVANVRSKRNSDVSFDEIGDDYSYNDLIDYRNAIAIKQNEKVSQINLIEDPAERYVAIEQDFPLISNKLNEYDEKINEYGNILETRKPVDINFNRDRRGNLEINLGGKQGKFRNTRRGIMQAESFYSDTKNEYLNNLGKSDNITKNASMEQDIPFINYSEKVLKQQKKAQKSQERQRIENMNDNMVGDFGPQAPSDTPTGTIRVPTPPRNIVSSGGLDKIFGNNEIKFPSMDKSQRKSNPFAKSQYKEPNYSSGMNDFGFNSKPKKGRKSSGYEKFF